MHSKSLLFFVFAAIAGMFSTRTHAQPYYNQSPEFLKANGVWTLYEKLGLNFNNRSNFQFISELSGIFYQKSEGQATVSDPNTGALLFYTNGVSCWDRTHTLMPNGVNGLSKITAFTGIQGATVVPVIGSPGSYYVFSLDAKSISIGTPPEPVLLSYSIVDMSLNNGLGDVVSGQKNIVLDSSLLSEAIIAVPGEYCDAWLITHSMDSAKFKAYHITVNGIDPQPVISRTGKSIEGSGTATAFGNTYYLAPYMQASMAISPDRKKIALTSANTAGWGLTTITASTGTRLWGSILSDFDPATGIVSNGMLIDTLASYNAAFSPDNSKLYISTFYNFANPAQTPAAVYQYYITLEDSTGIVSSKTKVPLTGITANSDLFALKLYNDTVYILRSDVKAIDRINKPNQSVALAEYEANVITLQSTSLLGYVGYTFPGEVIYPPVFFKQALDTSVCTSILNAGVLLTPTYVATQFSYNWSTGSSDSVIVVNVPGTYWVRYNNGCHFQTDTFTIGNLYLPAPSLTVNEYVLGLTGTYISYQWYRNDTLIPGETMNTHTVSRNGEYYVIVTNNLGCTDTSDHYKINNVSVSNMELEHFLNLYPNPTTGKLTIRSGIPLNDAHVRVYNALGQRLQEHTHIRGGSFDIDMNGYAAGMHYIEIEHAGKKARMKVIKK